MFKRSIIESLKRAIVCLCAHDNTFLQGHLLSLFFQDYNLESCYCAMWGWGVDLIIAIRQYLFPKRVSVDMYALVLYFQGCDWQRGLCRRVRKIGHMEAANMSDGELPERDPALSQTLI